MRLFLFLCILWFGACGTESDSDQLSENIKTIMPVGDSRVQGAHPIFESYRYELWKLLVNSEVEFDLAGNRKDAASYPEFMGKSFDPDHAGVSGYTTTDVLNAMNDIRAAVADPDIILLGIGGNDLLDDESVENTINNIRDIIVGFRASEDSVIIILEQIAPGKSEFMDAEMIEKFNNFNISIMNLGQELSTNASPVVVVNMAENWQDTYLIDNTHYNEAGAAVVAQRYFTAMVPFLD